MCYSSVWWIGSRKAAFFHLIRKQRMEKLVICFSDRTLCASPFSRGLVTRTLHFPYCPSPVQPATVAPQKAFFLKKSDCIYGWESSIHTF